MANFYEDSEEVKKKFKDSENEAEEMLKDSKKTQATLDNAMEKLKKHPVLLRSFLRIFNCLLE